MLGKAGVCRNAFLTRSVATPPVSVIRMGPKWWAEPGRVVRQKLMYLALAVHSCRCGAPR